MAKWKVGLLSKGGHRIPAMIVEARTSSQAKELAVLMANAQAKAKGESYVYHATSCNGA